VFHDVFDVVSLERFDAASHRVGVVFVL
jgi:hypothetical protein